MLELAEFLYGLGESTLELAEFIRHGTKKSIFEAWINNQGINTIETNQGSDTTDGF